MNGDSQPDAEAARQQELVPRQILLQCRALRTRAQQDTYLEWLRETERRDAMGRRLSGKNEPAAPAGAGGGEGFSQWPLAEADRARLLLPKTRIENFATRARAWYMAQVSEPTRTSLFLFYPAASEASTALKQRAKAADKQAGDDSDDDWHSMGGSGGGAGDMSAYLQVRRYPIPTAGTEEDGVLNGGGKTFNSLFFAQKPRVMQLLRDFQNGTGKYAIPGVPKCMTWLIHGPPGTGKTSLVKAMARYLNRHVVVLQIGALRTSTLFDAWMHEATVNCSDEVDAYCECYTDDSFQDFYTTDKNIKLCPSDVIYLLEDVDAIDKVEGLAKNDEPDHMEEHEEDNGSTTGGGDSSISPVEHAEEDSGSDEVVEESDSDSGEETESAKLRKAARKQRHMETLAEALLKEFKKDQLTVEAMIKTLNGVAVPSGRVVVMTTNHPERLDPRLTHPSVLSLKINMDDFDAEEATHMVRHYFPEYTARARLPPGASAADVQDEESRMTATLRTRLEALLARSTGSARSDTPCGSTVANGEAFGRRPCGRINPARLEQACAECNSVEELVEVLETGQYELRDNIY